jgi:hypothetical protein
MISYYSVPPVDQVMSIEVENCLIKDIVSIIFASCVKGGLRNYKVWDFGVRGARGINPYFIRVTLP